MTEPLAQAAIQPAPPQLALVLSPAKSLNFDADPPSLAPTEPLFLRDTKALIQHARALGALELMALMDISEALARLNVDRFKAWRAKPAPEQVRPAILAFNGDVYEGLQAATLSEADLQWAQQHVRLLSGLYGVLRPLDALQPYRLEMGTRMKNERGESLYDFWGDRLAKHLNELLGLGAKAGPDSGSGLQAVLVNLASQEYARAALRPSLRARVIECVFEDWKTDRYKIISFHAKRARGLMARFIIQRRLQDPQGLQGFAEEGYAFTPEASGPDRLVFRRRTAD